MQTADNPAGVSTKPLFHIAPQLLTSESRVQAITQPRPALCAAVALIFFLSHQSSDVRSKARMLLQERLHAQEEQF